MTKKLLICYGTRYGTTTGIVQEIEKTAEAIGADVSVVELQKKLPDINVDDYDIVIIGSAIQAGRWKKEPLEFIKKNIETLSTTKVALFVVCGDAGDPQRCGFAQEEYLDKIVELFPTLNVISTGLFGGMFDFKRYSFPVRALVKRIIKSRLPEGEELPEKMDFRDWDMIREWTRDLVEA
ncbi:MAG: flavodoxin domain-containing protein [Candidatus Thorarchaeota archaeon]|nr:MAG: hypothetical protein DRP09_07370 [Candidatus Thorarchaeota archaeon]RLI60282.1 MAG: hypothetical protein DRO87_00245 [Candidatus Thorarchaeota archaeon]